MVCQVEAIERVTIPGSMQIEERPPGTIRLHRYEWCPGTSLFFSLHRLRQLFYGWASEESSKRKLLAKNLLDLINKTSGKQRMSTQVKKVVPNSNRSHIQQFFPDLPELLMYHRRWSSKRFSGGLSDRVGDG